MRSSSAAIISTVLAMAFVAVAAACGASTGGMVTAIDAPLADTNVIGPMPDAPVHVDAPLVVDAPSIADAPLVVDAPVMPDAHAPIDVPHVIDSVTTPDGSVADSRHSVDAVVVDTRPSADGPPAGGACGGRGNPACGAPNYCDWADNSCGAADSSGTCTARPATCPQDVMLVCACDGTVYTNACLAASAGSDVNANGGCPAPDGTFACGPTYCMQGSEICQKTEGGAVGSQPSYVCLAAPFNCFPATCSCLTNQACGHVCSADANGDVTVTCQAP